MGKDELEPLSAAELHDALVGLRNLYADAREYRIDDCNDVDSAESEGADPGDVEAMRLHERTFELLERLIKTVKS